MEAGRRLLNAENPDRKPIAVFVTQTSGGQRTGWHLDRHTAVIRHVAGQGFAIVYVGTSAEQLAVEAVRAAAGGIGNSVAGRTSVSELAALLALSDVIVTLDTGPMHIGRAAGTPMVILAPSWQRPVEWMPLGVPNVRILRGEDRNDTPDGYQLDEITAESAISAFDEVMTQYPPSDTAREDRALESLSSVDHMG